MLAGLNPSGGSEGKFTPCLFPCLVVAGNPWHSVTHKYITPISPFIFTSPFLMCFSITPCLLQEHSHWI